jgi:hypothetical protein
MKTDDFNNWQLHKLVQLSGVPKSVVNFSISQPFIHLVHEELCAKIFQIMRQITETYARKNGE